MCSPYYPKIEMVIIFFASLFLFTIGLHSQEIIGFESRFYLFVLEASRHGMGFFPTTYQEPYPDYPGTSTFFILLFAKIFGQLNKLIAVLPSAIAASLTVCTTYIIGKSIHKNIGIASLCFLFFTLTFITEARTISLDEYVALVTVLSFAVVYFKKPMWITFIFLLIGFAFRGPLGLVVPAGVVSVLYLLEKDFKKLFLFGLSAILLLLFATAVLMGLAYYTGDYLFLQDVLRMQVVGRLHDPHSPPNYFYVRDCLTGYFVTYPLVIFVVWGFLRHKTFQQLLACVLIILIGLSIPSDKKMRYILPFAPFLALLCAYLYYEIPNKYIYYVRKIFSGFCLVVPLILVVAVFLFHRQYPMLLKNPLMFILIFITLQMGSVIMRKKDLALLALATTAFFIANSFIVEKINLINNQSWHFVQTVETLRKAYHTPVVFFQEDPDGLPIKYLVNMPHEGRPQFLYDANELPKLKAHTFVIISKENFETIPKNILQHFMVVTQNRLGHDDVVVVEKK